VSAMRHCVITALLLAATGESYSPAPVPNGSSPSVQSDLPHMELRPDFFPLAEPTFSGGFLPGSSIEDVEEENEDPAPGVGLTIPFQ
jgi:hypothetical protein